MGRLISVGYGRGVEVVINLVEAERAFGPRAGEVVDAIVELVKERCFRSLGVEPRVEESVAYVRVYGEGAGPRHLGFVEREAELLEARVLSRLSVVEHRATLFRSSAPLEPFRVAVYAAETERAGPASIALLWELARALRRVTGSDAAPAGRRSVCVVAPQGTELSPRLEFSTALGSVRLRLTGYRVVRPGTRWGDRVVKLMVNERVREALRSRGMLVDRLRAFFDYSLVSGAPVIIRRGYEFASALDPEGHVLLAVSPCVSVEARGPLAGEEVEVGARVRHLPTGLSGRLVYVGEGVCRARVGGALVEGPPSDFARIYDMEALARLGLAREVLRAVRSMHAGWERSVDDFARAVRRLEVAGQLLEFAQAPALLGV